MRASLAVLLGVLPALTLTAGLRTLSRLGPRTILADLTHGLAYNCDTSARMPIYRGRSADMALFRSGSIPREVPCSGA